MREITVRAFQAYGSPLEMVTYFEYFGQILTAFDDDWPAVVRNIRKARKIWTRLSRILLREGVNIGLSGMFCKAVVQALLLLGEEMWVMNPHMGRALGGFQHRVARQITERQPQRLVDGIW